ncbi:hypothetical protein FO519_004315 [Halicephalobus sp. NKZ332]|nr:hypothetical protein FO519_004315 [Halicephalobus sp. NKZ332]
MQNITLQSLADKYHNDTVLQEIAHYVCTHSNTIAPLPDLQCDEFPITHSISVQIFVATAFTLLILSAIIGNSVVMWIILYSKVMRRSFNFFLFNMAFADFLMALLNAGSTWSFNFYYDWWFGNFCPINNFFGIAPTCISVFTMMVVSWDRCAAVVNPLRKRQLSARCTVLIILFIWFLATVISLPAAIPARVDRQYFYSIPKKQLNERRICHNDFEYKFLRNSFFANPSLTKAPQHLRAKRRVIKMLGLVVLIFMVCWAPYQLYHLFLERLLSDFIVAGYMYMCFYWMAMSACVYNPIIYCYFNMRFRLGFRFAFRWLPCISWTQQEDEHNQLFPEARPLTSSTALKPDQLNNRYNTNSSFSQGKNNDMSLTHRKQQLCRNNSSGKLLLSPVAATEKVNEQQ